MADEPTTQPPPTQEAEPGTPANQETKPPWGSDDEFDPAKAWKLIENLRGDLTKAKTIPDDVAEKAKKWEEAEAAKKPELERVAGDRDTHKGRADKAEAELTGLRAALKHGVTGEDLEDFLEALGSGTAEEIEKRAAKLAPRFGTAGGSTEGDAPRRRPSPALKGGGAPDQEPEERDPRKLAAQHPRY